MKRPFCVSRDMQRISSKFLFALASIVEDGDRGQVGKCNYCPLSHVGLLHGIIQHCLHAVVQCNTMEL